MRDNFIDDAEGITKENSRRILELFSDAGLGELIEAFEKDAGPEPGRDLKKLIATRIKSYEKNSITTAALMVLVLTQTGVSPEEKTDRLGELQDMASMYKDGLCAMRERWGLDGE